MSSRDLLDESRCNDDTGTKVTSKKVDIKRNLDLGLPRGENREQGDTCGNDQDNKDGRNVSAQCASVAWSTFFEIADDLPRQVLVTRRAQVDDRCTTVRERRAVVERPDTGRIHDVRADEVEGKRQCEMSTLDTEQVAIVTRAPSRRVCEGAAPSFNERSWAPIWQGECL